MDDENQPTIERHCLTPFVRESQELRVKNCCTATSYQPRGRLWRNGDEGATGIDQVESVTEVPNVNSGDMN